MRALSTPVAVFLGVSFAGVCVALALYLALTKRGAAPTSELGPPLTAPLGSQPSMATVLVAPPGSTTHASAEAALALQHDKLVATCWSPLSAKPPRLPRVRYVVRLGFDANGSQSTRAFLDPIGPSQLDVTECIARTLQPLVVPPGDAGVELEVSLTLP